MNELIRSISVYADDTRIAEGCPIRLSARAEATLRPLHSVIRIGSLSESSRTLLQQSRKIRVCHEDSILAEGDILDFFTTHEAFPLRGTPVSTAGGGSFETGVLRRNKQRGQGTLSAPIEPAESCPIPVTTVIFSDTRLLHDLPVSITIPPATSYSEMLRLLLSSSGSGLALLHFSGTDGTLPRPRTFFGTLPEALNAVADLADARVFLTPSGLVCLGKEASFETADIPESDLLSEPMPTKDRIILSAVPKGWPIGATARVHWKDSDFTGTILERATEADNRSGPWFSQLILEVHSRE